MTKYSARMTASIPWLSFALNFQMNEVLVCCDCS